MTPWVDAWEKQFTEQPGALAVVNDRGQKYTYGDLRNRAKALEHRYNFLGLAPGDRLLVNWSRHQNLDDVVVTLWACGLRGACVAPYWSDFSKAKIKQWGLVDAYAPRLRVDTDIGEERVFAMPGTFAHDMAIAWPERRLDGAGRTEESVQWRWITHAHLTNAISKLSSNMALQPGDRVTWMDPGIGGLGWLTVFYALSVGASLQQVPILARRNSEFFDAWLDLSPCDWMVPSSDWCAHVGSPRRFPSKGVLSAWGQAMPHVRKMWGRGSRWLDVWAPASFGWWWGCQEWNGSDDEPFLPDHYDAPDWRFENGLLLASKSELAVAVQDKQAPHTGVHLALSNAADYSSRQAWHRALLNLRKYPRIGDIRCMEIDGQNWVSIVPRCASENSQHILDDVRDRLMDHIDIGYRGRTKILVADAFCPRDETGYFDVSSAICYHLSARRK
jgi:hypothetical protein